jgi:uncharacterized protein
MATWIRPVLFAWLVLGPALGLAFGLPHGARPAFAESSGIQVTGRGEAWVEPDLARFQFEVVRQGGDASALKQQVDDVVRRVLGIADQLGIDEQDVTAAVLQVFPIYRHQNGRSFLDGVTVRRNVQVTLRDLAHYQALVDGILAAGINQIHSVELDLAERGELQRQALDLAIDDARREAEHVAEAFGMRLGPVIAIDVVTRPVHPFPVAERVMRDAADTMRPGRISVERTVNARFALMERGN